MNSLAIESQLANLDFTAKTALYLNDDFFLTRVCPGRVMNKSAPRLTHEPC